MKWIAVLLLTTTFANGALEETRPGFPFNQATRLVFSRQEEAPQQYILKFEEKQWVVERRTGRADPVVEVVTADRAEQILLAFEGLHRQWHDQPYLGGEQQGYTMYIGIEDKWRTTINVNARESEALANLIATIGYPARATAAENVNAPGPIRASTLEQADAP